MVALKKFHCVNWNKWSLSFPALLRVCWQNLPVFRISALNAVVSALADPKKREGHIPYRDSKLTRILQVTVTYNYFNFSWTGLLLLFCICPSDHKKFPLMLSLVSLIVLAWLIWKASLFHFFLLSSFSSGASLHCHEFYGKLLARQVSSNLWMATFSRKLFYFFPYVSLLITHLSRPYGTLWMPPFQTQAKSLILHWQYFFVTRTIGQ